MDRTRCEASSEPGPVRRPRLRCSQCLQASLNPLTDRFVNSFNRCWDGARWWIAGVVWQQEGPGNPIPPE